MRLTVDTRGLEQLTKYVDPKVVEKATVRTLNEVGKGMSTRIVKDARSEYSIKASELKSYIRTDGASKGDFEFSLEIKSPPLSLSKFQMRTKNIQTRMGKRKGVTVKVLRKKKRKLVKGGFSPKGKQIFVREGGKRLPIKKLTTLSAPQMFKEDSIQDGYEEVERKLPLKLEQNLEFYLSKNK